MVERMVGFQLDAAVDGFEGLPAAPFLREQAQGEFDVGLGLIGRGSDGLPEVGFRVGVASLLAEEPTAENVVLH